MESLLREKHQLEKIVRDKDTELEQLKREKQQDRSKIKELEDKVVSLQEYAISVHSSSLEKQQLPTSLSADLPTRPSSPEKKQQPTSILANLPARPKFSGFSTPESDASPQYSLFAPTASPQTTPVWSTPLYAGVEPTTKPATLPALPTLLRGPPKEASASINPPAARTNRYYHGQLFSYIPVPQSAPLALILSSRPLSFDFNQQTGNTGAKRKSSPSTPFLSPPPLTDTQFGLPQSNPVLARSSSSVNPPFGIVPPRGGPSIGPTTDPLRPFGNRPGASSPSFSGNFPPSSSSSTDAAPNFSSSSGVHAKPQPPLGATLDFSSSFQSDSRQGAPSPSAEHGSSVIAENHSGSSAQLMSVSNGFSHPNLEAAEAPPSCRGPILGDGAIQEPHTSQSSTESGPIFGFARSVSDFTEASSTRQGPKVSRRHSVAREPFAGQDQQAER